VPSFDAYFGPIEQGASSAGQACVALPEEVRGAVREEVRRDLPDNGGYRGAWMPGREPCIASKADIQTPELSPGTALSRLALEKAYFASSLDRWLAAEDACSASR
jgi:hypothetical protein